jgi:hypothetical protein
MKTKSLPQEIVAQRQKTRESVKQLQKDLHDMQKLYEKEMGKKKVQSDFAPCVYHSVFPFLLNSPNTPQRSSKCKETSYNNFHASWK